MWRRFPLLTRLARESRNFGHRIAATLRARQFERGIDMGPEFERQGDGSYQECSETHRRIRDMQRLCTSRPSLTCLDIDLFLEGWTAGAQFGLNNRAAGKGRP